MSKHKRHINEFIKTGFANSGRVAGDGVLYDNYADESCRPHSNLTGSVHVNMPSDYLTAEEKNALNGEVRVYRGSVNGSKVQV